MLALPSSGWGQYQMEDLSIDNRMGQSVAFIPGRGWRLINDITAGTSVQFREEALVSRMGAIASELSLADASALLASPFVISMGAVEARFHYRLLLSALAIVDNSYRYGSGPPDPMLRLDDLVLRCVAMLLYPFLLALDQQVADQVSKRDLRRTVHDLMDWMQANLDRPISLSEMESRASYGRRALQHGFKNEVGCGPMQWLRKQRLLHAHQRLCSPGPETTVSQVAQACGYLNLPSFSRDFRERFGLSASELLRQSRPATAE
jgi:AraC-like DNA-binding protein